MLCWKTALSDCQSMWEPLSLLCYSAASILHEACVLQRLWSERDLFKGKWYVTTNVNKSLLRNQTLKYLKNKQILSTYYLVNLKKKQKSLSSNSGLLIVENKENIIYQVFLITNYIDFIGEYWSYIICINCLLEMMFYLKFYKWIYLHLGAISNTIIYNQYTCNCMYKQK